MAEFIARPGGETGVRDAEREETETPRRYKVVLLNDHYTTMEFVVEVLREVFRKSTVEAVDIMLRVHRQGRGVAGVYVKSVAETKADRVHRKAEEQGYPLRCCVEPE